MCRNTLGRMGKYIVSDRWLWLSFVLSISVLIAAQWFAHRGSDSVLKTLEHSSVLRSQTHDFSRLISAAKDAETGQRGFLLTHRASYLEPYYRGVKEVRFLLDEMRRAYANDPLFIACLERIEPAYTRR